MKKALLLFLAAVCLSLVLGIASGVPVHAEEANSFISVKGGSFSPAEDGQGTGTNFMLGYDFIGPSGFGWGLELGYKKFKRDITFEVEKWHSGGSHTTYYPSYTSYYDPPHKGKEELSGEVEVTSIPLLFNGKYHLLSNKVVKPYLGIGVGASFNMFDAEDEELEKKLRDRGGAISYIGQGLAGIRLVIAQGFCLFVEGKYSYEWSYLEEADESSDLNLGGFYGNGGIGIEF